MNCMQRQYSGYHFRDECKDNRTGTITSVHSYIDYTDINNSDSDKDCNDNIDINKVFNELKDNLQREIINE